jgi:MFS family permease
LDSAPATASVAEPSPSPTPSFAVSGSLGFAQILAWGGSFFFVAVMAAPVAADTGWPQQWIFGSLSVAIFVSGLLAPAVGRWIRRRGGRHVLAMSALILAAGIALVGLAPTLPLFVAAWVVVGVGMAAGMYDALFSALGQVYGGRARGAITQVTLVAGFVTTLSWPLSAFLIAHLGWRGACFSYAVLMVAVVLPIYLVTLPRRLPPAALPADAQAVPAGPGTPGIVLPLLASGFVLASVLMTAMSVQLLALLTELGVSTAVAIGLGAMIGPAQVGARLIEVFFGRTRHPIWGTLVATVLVAAGLLVVAVHPAWAALGIVLYGTGSGIRSIVRGTLPLAVFGPADYALVMGRIARPVLLAQAVTPLAGAWLQQYWGAKAALGVMCALAVLNIVLVAVLLPRVLQVRTKPG